MTVAIGKIAIHVSDLQRSERLYTEGLGFEVPARVESPAVTEVIVGTSGLGYQLMLAWDRESSRPVDPSGIWKVFLFTDDAASSYDAAPDGYLIEIGQRDD